jgi:hypothetical protein
VPTLSATGLTVNKIQFNERLLCFFPPAADLQAAMGKSICYLFLFSLSGIDPVRSNEQPSHNTQYNSNASSTMSFFGSRSTAAASSE